jgi:hypothetical protein
MKHIVRLEYMNFSLTLKDNKEKISMHSIGKKSGEFPYRVSCYQRKSN